MRFLKIKMERSEAQFQSYCRQRGYDLTRIEPAQESGVRSPDFSLFIKDREIIVEVKEITANDDDVRVWRDTRAGKVVVHRREPGKRARGQIEAAVGQLRPYAENGVPCVVVLYDNILVDGAHPRPFFDPFGPLGPLDIDNALYGLETNTFRFYEDGGAEALGVGRSRRRRVHDRECISAVCVLGEDVNSQALFLFTHHNYFARNPLPMDAFLGPSDRHLTKPKHPDQCPGEWTVLPGHY